jgi:hypothetical protein
MNIMSPPTGVHARPVMTPTSGLRSAVSWLNLAGPSTSGSSAGSRCTVSASSEAILTAAERRQAAISRSRLRTPASRV